MSRSSVLLSLFVVAAVVPARAVAHETIDFREIQPIIVKNCGGSGCHLGQETSGVELTSYETMMASVGAQYRGPIIIAGDADASPLIDKVSNSSPQHGSRMPLGGTRLRSSEIEELREWIDAGARSRHFRQRGDLDGDDARTITDAFRIINFLFGTGEAPDCFPPSDVNSDGALNIADVLFLLNFLFGSGGTPTELTSEENEECEDATELSYDSIYEKVIQTSCGFSSCHDAERPKGELDLSSADAAFASLVGVEAANDVARDAGMLRVDPGRPENSFLLKKLTEPGEGEGNRMPANSPLPLPETTLAAIREWILAGAPREGTIEGVPDIRDDAPPPVERLSQPPVPENGVQLHLPPYVVGAGRERQLHYFVGAPFADLGLEEVWVKRIDVHMLEQSHHFILYEWVAGANPPPGTREGSFTDPDELRLVLVSQQSFFSQTFPDGASIRFTKDTRFDLNSHYINLNGEETLLGEVYVNIFFADPDEVRSEVKPIFDFGGTIFVPPNQTTTARGTFPTMQRTRQLDPSIANQNGEVAEETHILALTSHMHRHGDRFEVWVHRDGENLAKVYDNDSWDDPLYKEFDPPLVLEPGDGLRYVATYTYDDPPSPTAPALRWGPTSEDEMIILLGSYRIPGQDPGVGN